MSTFTLGGTPTGRGLLWRVPAGVKLALLFGLGIVVYLVPDRSAQLILFGTAVLAVAVSGCRVRALVHGLLWIGLFALVIFTVTLLTASIGLAVTNAVRLLTVFGFAFAVTASTTYRQLLDVFDALFAPLRHLGLRPQRISLTLALTIRFIPEIRARYLQIREAQYARGLHSRPLAIMVPLLTRTLTDAEDIAAALDARCFDSEGPG